jgi:SAM-dependent methyltransferase
MAAPVLQDHEDALGQQLQDALDAMAGPAVLERDDGDSGPALGPEALLAEYDAWCGAERSLFEAARGRVLDIGCGAGRHSLEAARRGMEAVAIDISPKAIAVSRARGVADARLLSLWDADERLGTFDTVLMMCGNFGLPGTREQTVEWLQRLHGMTTPGARILLDTVDPYVDEDPGELAYLERNRSRGRMAGQVTIRFRYGERLTPWFDLLLVSAEELAQLAHEAGWRVAQLDGSESPDIYAMLEKAG